MAKTPSSLPTLWASRRFVPAICRPATGFLLRRQMASSFPLAKPSGGFAALWRFLPMLWPKGEIELKVRVVAAVLLVLAGKAVSLAVPYALKLAVDRMSAHAAF